MVKLTNIPAFSREKCAEELAIAARRAMAMLAMVGVNDDDLDGAKSGFVVATQVKAGFINF